MSAVLATVAAAGALLAGNAGSAAAVPPDVTSRWDNEILHDGASKEVNFFMDPGHYTMTAKLYAVNTGSSTITYQCTLHTGPGGDGDITQVTLAPNGEHAVFLNVVHTYPGSLERLYFGCSKPAGSARVVMRHVKITTVKVNTLSNISFNG
ncbi:hypothetical protein [Nonomuraea gerenzanensis]|uniref:hypothetical protein n=1 Tax=Nonomuraea gerenzanensis TaxID=93944 RepID=UPI001CDA190D|nr:hypothetical protein [Nonomuraea gerenzanensis]UBU09002.1 hypothetical protein LCN96_32025 [Nonomuraea gerenzanensis]